MVLPKSIAIRFTSESGGVHGALLATIFAKRVSGIGIGGLETACLGHSVASPVGLTATGGGPIILVLSSTCLWVNSGADAALAGISHRQVLSAYRDCREFIPSWFRLLVLSWWSWRRKEVSLLLLA